MRSDAQLWWAAALPVAGGVGQGACPGRACRCLGNSSAGRVAGSEGDKAQRVKLRLQLLRIKSLISPLCLSSRYTCVCHSRRLEGLGFLVLSELVVGLLSSQPVSLLVTVLFGLSQQQLDFSVCVKRCVLSRACGQPLIPAALCVLTPCEGFHLLGVGQGEVTLSWVSSQT